MSQSGRKNESDDLRDILDEIRYILDEIEEIQRLIRQSPRHQRRYLQEDLQRLLRELDSYQRYVVKHQLELHLAEYVELAADDSFQGRTLVSTYRSAQHHYGLHVAFLGSIYEGLAKTVWARTWESVQENVADHLAGTSLIDLPPAARNLLDKLMTYRLLQFLPTAVPLRHVFEAVPRIADAARALGADNDGSTPSDDWLPGLHEQVQDYCDRRASTILGRALRV